MSFPCSSRTRLRNWLWLVACAGACTGTPTPEPPDNLPAPDPTRIFTAMATVSTPVNPPQICELSGKPGAVPAGSSLWVVDLDDPGAPAVTLQADASGAFEGQIAAQVGDRVRLVVRSERQHSLPLDGVCKDGMDKLALEAPPDQTFACLELTPSDLTELLAAGEVAQAGFTLTNHCDAAIQIVSAELRFGDQGVAISDSPSTIPVDGTAELGVTLMGDGTTRTDIVLLGLASGTSKARYALGAWTVAKP